MGCLGIIFAILGIVGYYNGIMWLFYLAGGISAFMTVASIILGDLRCFGTLVTVFCVVSGYRLTGSFWQGLILGSCVSDLIYTIIGFFFMLLTSGISVALTTLFSIFGWIKGLFEK
jgi:hypothetical protein